MFLDIRNISCLLQSLLIIVSESAKLSRIIMSNANKKNPTSCHGGKKGEAVYLTWEMMVVVVVWDPNLNQLRSRLQLLCTTVSH